MVLSYSAMATFEQCPRKFKLAYIDRAEAPEFPPSPAMARGTKIHESVDMFLTGKTEFLHPDIHATYGQFMMSLKNDHKDLRPEFAWGVTWDFKPCDYDHPAAMIHGFVDLLILPEPSDSTILQYEWKTGNKYIESHRNQGWTYAVAMMTHFPERNGVDSMITYFDKVDYDKVHYPVGMIMEYRATLRRKISEIVDEKRFPALPSFKCKWCRYSRLNNGGPCDVG